jgi:hypothetical protein
VFLLTHVQRIPSLAHTQREVSELSYNDKRSTKLLEASEKALEHEKEEVARLYSSLQVRVTMCGLFFLHTTYDTVCTPHATLFAHHMRHFLHTTCDTVCTPHAALFVLVY